MIRSGEGAPIRFRFEARVIYWRGPAPFFFAPIPPDRAVELREVARLVTYGWGMIPIDAAIGPVTFYTALFPKDDTYLLPIKAAVRRKADVTAGDTIAVDMTIRPGQR
jgi:hypothetical protein